MKNKTKFKKKLWLFYPLIRGLVEYVFPTIAIIIFLFVFSLFLLNDSFPFKFKAYVVSSESMVPTFLVGDLLLVERQDNYSKNDIITYKKDFISQTVTHRIIKKNSDSFITKGDNNIAEDDWEVFPEEIRGKLIYTIPKVGTLVQFIQSMAGIIFFGIIPSTAVLAVYLNSRYQNLNQSHSDYIHKLKTIEP